MPSGKHISEEMRAEVLRLKAQGLTYRVIAKRTGLWWHTISLIVKANGRKQEDLAG